MRVLPAGSPLARATCARRFEALGVPTIDADALAREAVAPGRDGPGRGRDALRAGVLDRDRRARSPQARRHRVRRRDGPRDLEAIIHPFVREAGRRVVRVASIRRGTPFAIADIPLLFEAGTRALISTRSSSTRAIPRTQLRTIDGARPRQRSTRRGSESPRSCRSRRRSARADYVIRTDGTLRGDGSAGATALVCRVELSATQRHPSPSTGSSSAVGESFAGAIRSSTNVFHSWHCGHCQSSSVLR